MLINSFREQHESIIDGEADLATRMVSVTYMLVLHTCTVAPGLPDQPMYGIRRRPHIAPACSSPDRQGASALVRLVNHSTFGSDIGSRPLFMTSSSISIRSWPQKGSPRYT